MHAITRRTIAVLSGLLLSLTTAHTVAAAPTAADCRGPGARLKTPSSSAVYLVDPQGTLRHIPDGTVYDRLFDDWNYWTVSDSELSSCWPYPPRKYPLNGAHLVKTGDSAKVYIYDSHYNRYRWIVDGYTFATKYGFSWDKVRTQELDPDSIERSWPWR
ncbi:hypothetical protein ACFZAE_09245 [Streptomyces scabiei]|uniref:hypothetical protein n=1 Tax=Streptomyces scabiei TaxID=1930 RepID=UPI0036EFBFDA